MVWMRNRMLWDTHSIINVDVCIFIYFCIMVLLTYSLLNVITTGKFFTIFFSFSTVRTAQFGNLSSTTGQVHRVTVFVRDFSGWVWGQVGANLVPHAAQMVREGQYQNPGSGALSWCERWDKKFSLLISFFIYIQDRSENTQRWSVYISMDPWCPKNIASMELLPSGPSGPRKTTVVDVVRDFTVEKSFFRYISTIPKILFFLCLVHHTNILTGPKS